MGRKITVIGSGSVGSTIAYTMAVTGLASEVVMIDVAAERVLGEAMDIQQGTSFSSPCLIYAGSYEDTVGSDLVIITSGVPRKAGQSRIDLAQTNVDVICKIAPQIVKYVPDAMYIIVSNPVDVLTYVFTKVSGLPESRIIGSGTILDTARLRARLAECLTISQKSIHAYVMGEHGDSSFVPWSTARVGSVEVLDKRGRFNFANRRKIKIQPEEIEDYIHTSGGKIIARKGATFYGISISVCHIADCLFGSTNRVMTVSSMLHGEYGIDDVCLSIPFIFGPDGICGNVLPTLTVDELWKLRNSADLLKNVIKQVNF